jgi:transcription termination factor Rho
MSVLDRDALAASPLADLHTIASELGLDGFRRLRKADLIEAILARQGGDDATGAPDDGAAPEAAADAEADAESDAKPTADVEPEADADSDEAPSAQRPRRRGGRGRRRRDADPASTRGGADSPAGRGGAKPPSGRGARDDERVRDAEAGGDADTSAAPDVEGTVELLGNGSGFVRVHPPDASDDDVYLSAAQVRRCELVSGDVVRGPVRRPRRTERYASLVRVDSINGRPADQVAEGARFEDLPARFPYERFALSSDDATVRAIEWLTPFGRGSRVVISGRARAGKTETLRRLGLALAAQEGLDVSLVLVGVRPEELGEWSAAGFEPKAGLSFAAAPEARAQAVERTLEHARRVVARGGDAVVLIDTLDELPPAVARRGLAAARKIVDGGSLTVIASSSEPLGGETTLIALDERLTSMARIPALDLIASGTMRPELLVGDDGAAAIAKARGEAQEA